MKGGKNMSNVNMNDGSVNYVLQTKNISKVYGGKKVVDNVSINVKKGDIYGFIGKNGAGKTTLMRMICGLTKASSGDIELFGTSNLEAGRKKMGSTIENPALHTTMTAMENMEVQRLTLGIKDKQICTELLELAGIADTGKKKVKNFSLGMKQRLTIALTLLGNPEFIILDEPTNGLDPIGISETLAFLQHLSENRGIAILISSHILGELEKIATHYGVIHQGKLVDEFSAETLSERCEENLVLYTNNPQIAERIVKEKLPHAICQLLPDTTVMVKGHVEKSNLIHKALVEAGLIVNGVVPKRENLEDYFLKLMGGRGHV